MTEAQLWQLAKEAMTKPQYAAFRMKNGPAEMTIKEIANALGISPQAVQARLDGATRRMLKALESEAA